MDTKRRNKPLLGEILLERGLITKEDLDRALRVQVGGMRRLGYLLVQMKFITDVHLLEAISAQLGLPVIRIDEEFKEEVSRLLPRHLCRRLSVLPLALEENNVVRLAMGDPLDDVAIREVENFTGLAVQPALANVSEIRRAIGRVPLSLGDLFNPQVYKRVATISAAAALVLLCVAGLLTYREMQRQRIGTISKVRDSVIYKNHDLMVDLSRDGKVYFSGRGAYADGYYGVRFENPAALSAFLKSQRAQLSEEQRGWLDWVLERAQPEVKLAKETASGGGGSGLRP
jgi:hypothetical protein